VPFGGERRVRIQSARTWLQRGPHAGEEPVALHRVSRQRDSEGSVTRGYRGGATSHAALD